MSLTMSGSTFVRADRNTVWAALHDADLISLCIPGCQSLVRSSDRDFALELKLQLGLIRLAFDGTVRIEASDPPNALCLVGRGRGGIAGEAAGRAEFTLAEQFGGCTLRYAVDAEVRGPLSVAGPFVLTNIGTAISSLFAVRFGELVDGRRPPPIASV